MKPTTFPHVMAYLGGLLVTILTVLSVFDPNSLAALGPSAVKYAGIAVMAAVALLTALHQANVIPSRTPNAPSVTTVAKVLIPLILVLPFLHGCAALTKVETALSSPTAQPYLIAAADVAVATAESKGVSAAQITSIAQQALAADQGTAATLETVAAVANAQIAKLGLPAGDVQAAQILEAALTVAIQVQIGNNASIAQAQAAIGTVLNAIIAAANPTLVPVSSAPATTMNGYDVNEDAGCPYYEQPIAKYSGPAPTCVQALPAPAPQNKHFVLASVESPAVVGAASSLVLVASLQAFAHVSVTSPVAAAITVLFTVGSAAIANLIS
jgi:hypothetical protein